MISHQKLPSYTSNGQMSAEVFILLVIYSGFFSVTRVVGIEEVATNPLASKGIRIAFILITFLISLIIVFRRNAIRFIKTPSVLMLFFFFCSCLLSVPRSFFPTLSLFKSLEISQALLLSLIALSSFQSSPGFLFKTNNRILFFIIFIIIAETVIIPDLAWTPVKGETPLQAYMLRGVYPALNPNTVGLLGGLIATFSFPGLFNNREKGANIFLFLFGLTVVVLSYSRSTLIAVFISLLITLFLMKKRGIIFFTILGLISAFLLKPTMIDVIFNHMIRGQDVESAAKIIADRPTIWKLIWNFSKDSLIGMGFSATFRHPVLSRTGWGHAHNTFFQLLGDLGWIGVIIWIVMILNVLRRLLQIHVKKIYESKIEFCSIFTVFVFLTIKVVGHSTIYSFGYDFIVFVTIFVYAEKTIMKSRKLPLRKDMSKVEFSGRIRTQPGGFADEKITIHRDTDRCHSQGD